MTEYKRCMAVNFFGAVEVTKEFLPLLRKSKGRLVNISSMAGELAFPPQGRGCQSHEMQPVIFFVGWTREWDTQGWVKISQILCLPLILVQNLFFPFKSFHVLTLTCLLTHLFITEDLGFSCILTAWLLIHKLPRFGQHTLHRVHVSMTQDLYFPASQLLHALSFLGQWVGTPSLFRHCQCSVFLLAANHHFP